MLLFLSALKSWHDFLMFPCECLAVSLSILWPKQSSSSFLFLSPQTSPSFSLSLRPMTCIFSSVGRCHLILLSKPCLNLSASSCKTSKIQMLQLGEYVYVNLQILFVLWNVICDCNSLCELDHPFNRRDLTLSEQTSGKVWQGCQGAISSEWLTPAWTMEFLPAEDFTFEWTISSKKYV